MVTITCHDDSTCHHNNSTCHHVTYLSDVDVFRLQAAQVKCELS